MDKRVELIKWACTKIGLPFIWGESDCTTITLEGIKLYYGMDFSLDKSWTSFKNAKRALKKYGIPIDILTKNGFDPVKKNYEQTGDILIWEGRGYYFIGFVINSTVMVADEGSLLHMRPISSFESYLCLRSDKVAKIIPK